MLGQAVGFRDCEAPALQALVAAGQLRSLARGEYAVRRGDQSRSAWFVVTGLVDASITHSEGHRHLLGLLLPGDFFSLMGVVDDHGSEYDVSAREPSVALVIPFSRLRELRAQYPSVMSACEKQFVFRARLFQRRTSVDPGVSLDTRVAGLLHLLSTVYGRASPEGIRFFVKLTQTDMADWLGLSRQRMNFVLKQLEAEGLVRLHYSSIMIVNPQGLAARAEH